MATNKDFIVKNGLSVGEDISVSGSVTSNLQFDDNIKAQFGNNSDLQIYSDDTHSYIQESSTQGLRITSDNAVAIRKHDDENIALFNVDGAVRLYHDSFEKFSTSSTGINVTGNAVLTGELRGPASFVIDPAAVGDNTGEVVIKGDLTVEGTTTTVNSTTLDVADKNITLNHGSGDTSASADGAGITIQDAVNASTDATILWNATNDRFDFSHPVSITGNLNASGDIIGSSSLQIFRSSAGAASVILQRNGAAGPWSLAQGNTSTDYFEIIEGSNTRMTIANGGATTFSGNLTSNGTITGADYSGITMGGSLSGSHDDAKVQYGTTFSGTPAQGHFFFDSLNQKLKVYTGSAFVDAVPAGGGGGGGGGSTDATATFRKYTYTLTGTTNAISGKEDDEVTTGDFISGRLYEITAVGNTDFTLIGASSNAIGVQFTATDVGDGSTGKAKEVLFYATGGTQNIEVYVNGVKAVEGSSNDYVATTGTSVTFTSNLVSGDVVDIQVYELLTQDSFYLKSETYTQAQTIAGFVAKSGDTMTGNLTTSGTFKSDSAFGGFITLKRSDTTTTNNSDIGAINFEHTDSDDAGVAATILTSGDGTAGGAKMRFYTGTPTTRQERLTILSNGNVGIGVVQPDDLLHINGNLHFENEGNAIIFETSSSAAAAEIKTGDTFGSNRLLIQGDNGIHNIIDSNSNGTGDWSVYNDNLSTHQLFVRGATGGVGIGVALPEGALHLKNANSQYAELILERDSTGVEAKFDIKPYAGSLYVREYTTSGNNTTNDIIQITDTGHFLPISASQDIGSTTKPWRNMYTQDLVLSNEKRETGNDVDGTKGNWTIQEGEEHLYIINNRSGKKYKFALEEIE